MGHGVADVSGAVETEAPFREAVQSEQFRCLFKQAAAFGHPLGQGQLAAVTAARLRTGEMGQVAGQTGPLQQVESFPGNGSWCVQSVGPGVAGITVAPTLEGIPSAGS